MAFRMKHAESDDLEEAHQLVSQGAVELNLVAQDLTAYGHDLAKAGLLS